MRIYFFYCFLHVPGRSILQFFLTADRTYENRKYMFVRFCKMDEKGLQKVSKTVSYDKAGEESQRSPEVSRVS